MKLGQSVPGAKGSFGVPPELKAEGDRMMASVAKDDSERPSMDGYEEPQEHMPKATADDDVLAEEGAARKPPASSDSPLDTLSKYGVELEDEDFHKVLFKGFMEKEVVIVPAFRTVKALSATIRTLTVQEYDEVDELLAEDMRDVKMTQDGFNSRRSMWILSYGIVRLQGKPVHNPVYVGEGADKEFDSKATARKRREVLGKLGHAAINRMIYLHAAITVAIEAIVQDPEAYFLKKP